MNQSKFLCAGRGVYGVIFIVIILSVTSLTKAAPLGGQPVNDLCQNAIPIDVPSVTQGTTINATVDNSFPTCGVPVTSPGVWYSVVGTGNTMTASLCDGTDFDSRLSVSSPQIKP